MPEPCPFCAKPITREYGSFRCKNCARSSEDLIDLERKTRAAELRKQARAALASRRERPSKAERLKAVALAVARHKVRKLSADSEDARVATITGAGSALAPRRRRRPDV